MEHFFRISYFTVKQYKHSFQIVTQTTIRTTVIKTKLKPPGVPYQFVSNVNHGGYSGPFPSNYGRDLSNNAPPSTSNAQYLPNLATNSMANYQSQASYRRPFSTNNGQSQGLSNMETLTWDHQKQVTDVGTYKVIFF